MGAGRVDTSEARGRAYEALRMGVELAGGAMRRRDSLARDVLFLADRVEQAERKLARQTHVDEVIADTQGWRERTVAAEARVAALEEALRTIADPSYVGNYSDAEVVEIYRKWAGGATREQE